MADPAATTLHGLFRWSVQGFTSMNQAITVDFGPAPDTRRCKVGQVLVRRFPHERPCERCGEYREQQLLSTKPDVWRVLRCKCKAKP